MKKQYKRAVDTRRLYREENTVLAKIPHINRQLSLGECQRWVSRICATSKYEAPTVQFGPGVRHGNQMLSWCDNQTICLAPGQRDACTIAHECVHFLGPQDHDNEFRKLYFHLLKKYFNVDAKGLIAAYYKQS